MRMIGKRSLSSMLAMGLHVIRLILWLILGGVFIALLVIPLLPLLLEFVAGFEGTPSTVEADIEADVEAGDYFKLIYIFLTSGIVLYVVNRLLEVLKTLRFGSPFVMENADRFREVGYALLLGEGLKIIFAIWSFIIGVEADIEISLMGWVAVIVVFVLSEVFREGARMKEEQDLTV